MTWENEKLISNCSLKILQNGLLRMNKPPNIVDLPAFEGHFPTSAPPRTHATTQSDREGTKQPKTIETQARKTADPPNLAIQIWRTAVASAEAARKPLLPRIEMEQQTPNPKRKRPKERSAPKAQKEQEKSKTHVKDPTSQGKHACQRPVQHGSP